MLKMSVPVGCKIDMLYFLLKLLIYSELCHIFRLYENLETNYLLNIFKFINITNINSSW